MVLGALIPLGFGAGLLVGGDLLSMHGFESGTEETLPLRVVLIAGTPAVTMILPPVVGAVVFGFRAQSYGAPSGVVPAIIGAAIGAFVVITNLPSWVWEAG